MLKFPKTIHCNRDFLPDILFNRIPEKNVFWSATQDNLVLTIDGDFMLNDLKGEEIWKADLNGCRVAYEAMLDT